MAGCTVYHFRNSTTTICWDTYGWFVRRRNGGTMAYGSDWGWKEVFYREGFTEQDIDKDRSRSSSTCECTR